MEALRGDIIDDSIDDSIDDEIVKPDNTTTNSSPVESAQDDWDSGDDDSTSTFFNKEDWIPALSEPQTKSSSNRYV